MFMHPNADFSAATRIDLDRMLFPAAATRSGLVTGTRVETATGWRPVETLASGDAVYTLDGGLREIRTLRHEQISLPHLIAVPGGVLDNCADLMLPPAQLVLMQTEEAAALYGTPLVLVPAAALVGWRGIGREQMRAPVALTALGFDEEEIVWSNTGALLHCPASEGIGTSPSDFFTVLGMEQARTLIRQIGRTSDPRSLRMAA